MTIVQDTLETQMGKQLPDMYATTSCHALASWLVMYQALQMLRSFLRLGGMCAGHTGDTDGDEAA